MGQKKITTKKGEVYFIDDVTGKRVITGTEEDRLEQTEKVDKDKINVNDLKDELPIAKNEANQYSANKLWIFLGGYCFILGSVLAFYDFDAKWITVDVFGRSFALFCFPTIIAGIHRLITKKPSTKGMFIFYFILVSFAFISIITQRIREKTYLEEKERKSEINFLEQGLIHYNIKEYSLARDCFGEMLKQKPADKKILNLLGLTYTYLGKYDSALYVFDSLIKEDDSNWYFYFNRGNAHYFKRNLDLAYEDFHQATALNPDYALAYNNLGRVSIEKGFYERAINELEKANSIDPNIDTVYNNLGYAFSKKGEDKKAIEYYLKAISFNRNYDEPYNNIGILLVRKGESKLALEYLDKAKNINPKNPFTFVNIASAYMMMKDKEKAKESLRIAEALGYAEARKYLNLISSENN